jgi:hypothetical protein
MGKTADSWRLEKKNMNGLESSIQTQEFLGKSCPTYAVIFVKKKDFKLFRNVPTRFDRDSAFSKAAIRIPNVWERFEIFRNKKSFRNNWEVSE